MRILSLLILACLALSGCFRHEDSLVTEARKVESQMKEMAYYAPTLKAFEERVDSIHQLQGKWPESTSKLFAPGAITARYKVDGLTRTRFWNQNNFKIEILRWKAGRPVYRLKFAGLEREMEM